MLNSIPVIGWLMDLGFKISLAFPFWIVWSVCGIGEKYFYFLPQVYKDPGFWDCVGVFIVIPILKSIFLPRLSVSNKQTVGKTEDEVSNVRI